MKKLGQYREAIKDYTKVIGVDQENIQGLHNRCIPYERLSLYKEATRDFSNLIEIDTANAKAYFNRGCCYDRLGELDLAISDYSVNLEFEMRNGGANVSNNLNGTSSKEGNDYDEVDFEDDSDLDPFLQQ